MEDTKSLKILPVKDVANTWHTEFEKDPYFISAVNFSKTKWKITRQVDMSWIYRAHQVTVKKTGIVICDCEGFRRGNKCRHVEMIKILIEA